MYLGLIEGSGWFPAFFYSQGFFVFINLCNCRGVTVFIKVRKVDKNKGRLVRRRVIQEWTNASCSALIGRVDFFVPFHARPLETIIVIITSSCKKLTFQIFERETFRINYFAPQIVRNESHKSTWRCFIAHAKTMRLIMFYIPTYSQNKFFYTNKKYWQTCIVFLSNVPFQVSFLILVDTGCYFMIHFQDNFCWSFRESKARYENNSRHKLNSKFMIWKNMETRK